MKRQILPILTNLILLLAATTLSTLTAYANIRLPHLFSDHMMLQQQSACPIWGWASPGEKITIKGSWGAETITETDADGKWNARITTKKYGGPYTITIIGNNTVVINDVLIGEVWLASGQSNMEIPLMGWLPQDTIFGAYQTIKNANNDNIRFANVKQQAAFEPKDNCDISWHPINPETATYCSAVAYFYATKINAETGIPIGIINASWGGCNAESWVDIEYLKALPEYKEKINEYMTSLPLQLNLHNWIKKHPVINPEAPWPNEFSSMKFNDEECAKLSFDDSKWESMRLPCYYDNPENIGNYDGVVWFRKKISIPDEWQGKKLILSLGPIDDMDAAFVNGEKVGETMESGYWNLERKYTIQPGLIRAGEMLIAIRMLDNGNGGGIYGRADLLKIYPEGEENNPDNTVYLAGMWKYLPTCEYLDDVLYQYDHKKLEYYNRPKVDVTLSNKTLAANYYGMLKPLIPFKVAGVIWYQGETNIGRAEEYYKLLPILIQCWRDAFKNQAMKFYYAQIAPYDFGFASPAYEIREAQRRCMSVINGVGMATLLDLGRKETMHPVHKKEVGERLARWALNDLYGKKCETSGPNFRSMVINKNTIELTFDHAESGLVAKGGRLSGFEISDSRGNFLPAEAEISGDKVIVKCAEIPKPKNVRYCWQNYIRTASLFNRVGLPASSFTTEKRISPKKQVFTE
jgi:sialate O-acetylesterase